MGKELYLTIRNMSWGRKVDHFLLLLLFILKYSLTKLNLSISLIKVGNLINYLFVHFGVSISLSVDFGVAKY